MPRRNLVPKPAALSFEEAACLPTAYLTAYRMLFDSSGLQPGATVLVQGAGGGVATALIVLGRAAGFRVWATSRSEAKRERALELGADQVFGSGGRLPERVDAVMETVGQATWAHSLRALRPGGRIVICGATSGAAPPAELNRVFFLQLSVVGSTMGSRDELARLMVLLRADRRAAPDRPDAAADPGRGRVRRDDRGRAVRQGRVHPLAGRRQAPGCPLLAAGLSAAGLSAAGLSAAGLSAAGLSAAGLSAAGPVVDSPGRCWPGLVPNTSVWIRSSVSSRMCRRSPSASSLTVWACQAAIRSSPANCRAMRSRSR